MNKYVELQKLPDTYTIFKTVDILDTDTDGFLVNQKNMITRKPGVYVTYKDYVPGAGGDLWWCRHQDGSVAAYLATELLDVE